MQTRPKPFRMTIGYLDALRSCFIFTPRTGALGGFRVQHPFGPGAFVSRNQDTKKLEEVTDDDAPWEDFAIDVPFGKSMLNWAWLKETRHRRTGSHRIDRLLTLVRFMQERVPWLQHHREDPRSGWLPPGVDPRVGMSFTEHSEDERWAQSVVVPGHSDDPDYPFPLSWYGQLSCIWPRLREDAECFLSSFPVGDARSLAALAAREMPFLFWDDGELRELEHAQGELLRAGLSCGSGSQPRDRSIVLRKGERTVLCVLVRQSSLIALVDLASAVGAAGGPRDPGTIGKFVSRLIALRLAERPNGPRAGVGATALGRLVASEPE